MPVVLRSATDADAKHVESLLAELGYPSKEVDVRHRLRRSLDSDTSCFSRGTIGERGHRLGYRRTRPLFPERLDNLQSHWSRRLDTSSWPGCR